MGLSAAEEDWIHDTCVFVYPVKYPGTQPFTVSYARESKLRWASMNHEEEDKHKYHLFSGTGSAGARASVRWTNMLLDLKNPSYFGHIPKMVGGSLPPTTAPFPVMATAAQPLRTHQTHQGPRELAL